MHLCQYCVVKQTINDGGGAITKLPFHDLEQVEQIVLQVATYMAQAILPSMGGAKGHKAKGG